MAPSSLPAATKKQTARTHLPRLCVCVRERERERDERGENSVGIIKPQEAEVIFPALEHTHAFKDRSANFWIINLSNDAAGFRAVWNLSRTYSFLANFSLPPSVFTNTHTQQKITRYDLMSCGRRRRSPPRELGLRPERDRPGRGGRRRRERLTKITTIMSKAVCVRSAFDS